MTLGDKFEILCRTHPECRPKLADGSTLQWVAQSRMWGWFAPLDHTGQRVTFCGVDNAVAHLVSRFATDAFGAKGAEALAETMVDSKLAGKEMMERWGKL